MPARVYLDHASTSPARPQVVEAMVPWLGGGGDPGRVHSEGRAARAAVEGAREQVAALLGVRPRAVVFTSGATEAVNAAVWGATRDRPGAPVLCAAVEHAAVRESSARAGAVEIGVDATGRIDLDDLERLLDRPGPTGPPALVHCQWGNHEVATLQPVAEVVEACRRRGVPVHVDAAAAAGHVPLALDDLGADLVSVSAHKVGGPQGVGALVVREGTPVRALLHGGGQERERRSGTHNVAGIVGMAAAFDACAAQRSAEAARIRLLRDRLVDGLVASVPGCTESGDRATKVPGIASLLFEGIESEALLVLLDRVGVCATAASSCASGALEPSHVLAAMGVPRQLAAGSLRLSLGWTSTEADVDHALSVVPECVARLRRSAA